MAWVCRSPLFSPAAKSMTSKVSRRSWRRQDPLPASCWLTRATDADTILADLKDRGVAAVIPAKRNRKVQPVIDGNIYALRNLVERCFSKLKHSRRLATRYDKTASSFLGFVLISAIRLWVRHFSDKT